MEKEKKIIEAVCNGNVGRSPLVEIIMRQQIEERGISDRYSVTSSGVRSDTAKANYTPEEARSFVEFFRRIGWNDASVENLDQTLRQGNQDLVPYIADLGKFAMGKEIGIRDRLLRERGIDPSLLKRTYDQTIATPDVSTILAVDRNCYSRAREIYQNSSHTPDIYVLSELATGEKGKEITFDVEGLTSETIGTHYEGIVDQIINETPLALEKIISRAA